MGNAYLITQDNIDKMQNIAIYNFTIKTLKLQIQHVSTSFRSL